MANSDHLENNSEKAESISPNTEPLWTVEEVARYLKLEPETVRSMAREGKLPGIKVGKVWRFKKSTLTLFLESNSSQN